MRRRAPTAWHRRAVNPKNPQRKGQRVRLSLREGETHAFSTATIGCTCRTERSAVPVGARPGSDEPPHFGVALTHGGHRVGVERLGARRAPSRGAPRHR